MCGYCCRPHSDLQTTKYSWPQIVTASVMQTTSFFFCCCFVFPRQIVTNHCYGCRMSMVDAHICNVYLHIHSICILLLYFFMLTVTHRAIGHGHATIDGSQCVCIQKSACSKKNRNMNGVVVQPVRVSILSLLLVRSIEGREQMHHIRAVHYQKSNHEKLFCICFLPRFAVTFAYIYTCDHVAILLCHFIFHSLFRLRPEKYISDAHCTGTHIKYLYAELVDCLVSYAISPTMLQSTYNYSKLYDA